ncbi:MAG TPA: hypothetical protein VMW25_03860 [Clostridia bacterium]|nr:hypothetical protein [Clostridia bacterium]
MIYKKKLTPPSVRSFPASPPLKPESKQTRTEISEKEARAMDESPQYVGEEGQEGRMSDPESDNDTLASIQKWGFYIDANGEHPKEIDEQKQLTQAEKARRQRREK